MAANKNPSIFRTTNRSRAGECRHEPTHVLAIRSLFRKRSWPTARHLCTSENSVDNFYIFFYQPPNYLRVYSVVFLYPSAVRWVSLSFSVVWCGWMSFSEHKALTYKDRCSGLASNAGRRLEEQEVLDGSAWCLPLGSSMWKKMKICDLASGMTTSKVEITV